MKGFQKENYVIIFILKDHLCVGVGNGLEREERNMRAQLEDLLVRNLGLVAYNRKTQRIKSYKKLGADSPLTHEEAWKSNPGLGQRLLGFSLMGRLQDGH